MSLDRRQIIRRRRVAVLGAMTLVIALGIYLPLTLLAPVGPTAARILSYATPERTTAQLAWADRGASAIGAVGYPGVLASSGSADPLPIASISKIVTSLVVLEAKPLQEGSAGPAITFSREDAALTAKYIALNGETRPMTAGSTMSELDLMRVTLIASANNYADALAGWAFGSRSAFLDAVSSWLASNGLDHTTLVEPTGIDPQNVSTTSDLVKLGKLALANPVIASIVSTDIVTVEGIGTITNTNSLLGRYGVEGIKTGTLNGISNLLFAAKYRYGAHSITVVGSVIGEIDHKSTDASVRALLATVKSGFHEVNLSRTGQAFARFITPWQSSVSAVASRATSILVWSNTPITAAVSTNPIRLATKNSGVGMVTFTSGTQTVRVRLALERDVRDPGPWWRLINPFTL